jgi:hypothetical protein
MDNFEEDIRTPDEVVHDQLIEDIRNDFEKQIDEAIYISGQEIRENQILHKQFEDQILKDYAEETNRRTEMFKDFLFNLNKIGKFDKEVREIYNILDPIIDSYCSQIIQTCELDEKTYDKIFIVLKKIRNNPLTLTALKKIILRE